MIVGVDEVGRGCWAGPLVAGAVALHVPIPGLKDSKVLTKKSRERLSAQIMQEAAATGIGWVSVPEINKLGLTASVRLAMKRAIKQLECSIDQIIIDGNYNFFPKDPRVHTLIKADALEPAVSAASIIAKVARDDWMATKAVKMYPNYHFEKHVGYGTALHRQLLRQYGVSSLHRQSYKPIQELLNSL